MLKFILATVTMALALANLAGCSTLPSTNNATASESPQTNAYVNPNDPNAFQTISQAIAAAPSENPTPFIIAIAPGNYYEKITVNKTNITLIGSGQDKTQLFYDAYAGQLNPATHKNWGTSGSATLTIRAPGFTASDLTIANSFDYPSNEQLPAGHPQKQRHVQAVAVLTDVGSDQALFESVTITGYQDTLYLKSGRSLFRNVFISGHVDFIFGAGRAVLWQSEIQTRARFPSKGASTPTPIGYITAPSTQISQEYGLVFMQCRLTREAGVANNSMALGRPWHPTTNFADGRYADPNAIGQSVFLDTWMDGHIAKHAWHPMNGTARNGGKIPFMPEDARFFEYQSHGPGAQTSNNRRQLNAEQAAQFTPSAILDHWWPAEVMPLP